MASTPSTDLATLYNILHMNATATTILLTLYFRKHDIMYVNHDCIIRTNYEKPSIGCDPSKA